MVPSLFGPLKFYCICFAIKSYLLNIFMVSVLFQFVINAVCFETDGPISLVINAFLASVDFCRLLITFANSLDPDQDQQNVGLDLDPNRLTL